MPIAFEQIKSVDTLLKGKQVVVHKRVKESWLDELVTVTENCL